MLAGAAWRVTASGAGPPAVATTVTDGAPIGLFVLAGVLVLDITAMAWRMLVGRPRRREPSPPALVLVPPLTTLPVATPTVSSHAN